MKRIHTAKTDKFHQIEKTENPDDLPHPQLCFAVTPTTCGLDSETRLWHCQSRTVECSPRCSEANSLPASTTTVASKCSWECIFLPTNFFYKLWLKDTRWIC